MTTNLSNRLRAICDRHDAIGNMPLISTSELLRYADLIDQRAAEIADLKLRLNRWNSGDNSIGCKYQVKRLKAERDAALESESVATEAHIVVSDRLRKVASERDEWRRRAERLLVLATKHCNKYHHDWREITEAAQWFEE